MSWFRFLSLSLTIILHLNYLGPSRARAALIPGVASSGFAQLQPGLFFSKHGYQVHAGQTLWTQSKLPPQDGSLVVRYTGPKTSHHSAPQFVVREVTLKAAQTQSEYLRGWIKDYPRLGFQVLATQKIKWNQLEGILLDLLSPDTHLQMRQVMVQRGPTVVVMSCRDHIDEFAKTAETCNQLIQNFTWPQ